MKKSEVAFYNVRCVKTNRDFLARYDKGADGKWVLTYGVKSNEISDSDRNNININIDISKSRTGPQYKCPYCGNRDYVRCGKCKKLTCKNSSSSKFVCAHCGNEGEVSSMIGIMSGIGGNGQ